MTSGIFDCRSCDLQGYACDILKKRIERFSTVYACTFISSTEAAIACGDTPSQFDGQQAGDMILTASSTGDIGLYRVADLVTRWTSGQQSGEAVCVWRAHRGPVYCLTKAQSGADTMILSGGDDGYVRGWRLSDIMRHIAAAEQHQPQATANGGPPLAHTPPAAACGAPRSPVVLSQLADCLAVRLPRSESPLAAIALPPAVQALALGAGSGSAAGPTLFVGCSDGGVQAVDLTTGSVAMAEGTVAGAGHAAAVLALDHHGPSACLASGSEDGTVRLWDTRSGAGAGCSAMRTLDAGSGLQVAAGGAEALRSLRGPHVACLRFDASGSWLLTGQGAPGGGGDGGGGALGMWHLGMGCRSKMVPTGFLPQAMVVQPSEVLVAGSTPVLCTYSLALDGPATSSRLDCRSVFGLDVHAGSGSVVVGGVGGAVELLSRYGKKTGGVYFVSDED